MSFPDYDCSPQSISSVFGLQSNLTVFFKDLFSYLEGGQGGAGGKGRRVLADSAQSAEPNTGPDAGLSAWLRSHDPEITT